VQDEAEDYDSAPGRSTAGSGKKYGWGTRRTRRTAVRARLTPALTGVQVGPREAAHGKRST
jgi:hypothetical protein